MSISKLSDASNHTALPLSYMVTANNGITRWEVKLSCQTSRCWGSKITEGTFSINTEVFGKQTNRLTTRLPVSMFGIRVVGAWNGEKATFQRYISWISNCFVSSKRGKNLQRTERKQKLVDVKMQDSKLKWNQLKYSKTEKLVVSYKQCVTKNRKLSLVP